MKDNFLHVLNKAIEQINETRNKKGNALLSVTSVHTLDDYENWLDRASDSEVLEVVHETRLVLFELQIAIFSEKMWKTIPSHKHSKLKAQ